MSVRIEAGHLLVHRLDEGNAETLFAVLSDAEVMGHVEPPSCIARTRAFTRETGLCEPPLVHAVVWKQSGPLIGRLIWHLRDEGTLCGLRLNAAGAA